MSIVKAKENKMNCENCKYYDSSKQVCEYFDKVIYDLSKAELDYCDTIAEDNIDDQDWLN